MVESANIVVSLAVVCLLSTISWRNFKFWQTQPGVRRLPVQTIEIAIGAAIFVLLNLSTLFFDDSFSRPAVSLIAAGTYYAFARLCARSGQSIWRHRRFHTIALGVLMFAAAAAAFAPLGTPEIVLMFAALTHWEQWKFSNNLRFEHGTDLESLRNKMRTLQATAHNSALTEDVEDDNLDVAG